MLDKIIRTGSKSQDALRLGFQTTCAAGIEKLLKVDDITTEACAEFKERHLAEVQAAICDGDMSKFEQELEDYQVKKFHTPAMHLIHRCFDTDVAWPFSWINAYRLSRYEKAEKAQEKRKIDIEDITVMLPVLNITDGCWDTTIKYIVKAHAWEGLLDGKHTVVKEEAISCTKKVTTNAVHCYVKYIPYDEYSERYIPDEAVQAAHEAKIIGMTELCVAKPMIATTVDRDPIIVGKIENQMFIIAWFGYDKNDHMACNL